MTNTHKNSIYLYFPTWTRYLGLAGILGGALLFLGDLLFYIGPMPEHTDFKAMNIVPVPIENMALVAEWRLVATAIIALISTWLYVLGGGLLYFILKPANNSLAILSTGLFCFIAIGIGIEHIVYFAAGISAKNAYALGADYRSAVDASTLSIIVFDIIGYIVVIPAIALTGVYYSLVWQKGTLLPRWSIFLFPSTIIATQYVVIPLLPNTLFKVILVGGYFNLSMIIFFLTVTVLLWNKADNTISQK